MDLLDLKALMVFSAWGWDEPVATGSASERSTWALVNEGGYFGPTARGLCPRLRLVPRESRAAAGDATFTAAALSNLLQFQDFSPTLSLPSTFPICAHT